MRGEMEMQDQKEKVSEDGMRNGAMRIFQALSSVDEELLVRSEEEKKVIPFRRYTKVMIACICFVMLGVVTVTSMRISKENASSDCAAPESAVQIADAGGLEDRDGTAVDMEADITASSMEAAAEEEAVAEVEVAADEKVSEVPVESGSEEAEAESVRNDQIHDTAAVLDEESLRTTDVLGEYVPKEIPSGYIFADGYRDDVAEGSRSINLTWLNGMDYISITVREYAGEAELTDRLVDVNQPIFMESDFTIDMVEARMESIEEAGDTDTPRGNFAVLYDSGVLVEFSGCGDAESIWNMFQSIEAEAAKKE